MVKGKLHSWFTQENTFPYTEVYGLVLSKILRVHNWEKYVYRKFTFSYKFNLIPGTWYCYSVYFGWLSITEKQNKTKTYILFFSHISHELVIFSYIDSSTLIN